jgi:hypothetical protein
VARIFDLLFTFDSFWKTIDVCSQQFWQLFSWKKLCISFDKNGLGHILGDFFTNSSGHYYQNTLFNAGS